MADFNFAFGYMITNEDYAPDDPRYGTIHTDNDGGLVRFGVNSNSMGTMLLNTTFYTTMPNDGALVIAKNLYNGNEWQSIQGTAMYSQPIASKVFDMAVNMGVKEAAKLCQRAAGVGADGDIGPLTVAAVNAENETTMMQGLISWWIWFIGQEIINRPSDQPYKEAWIARAMRLPD